MNVDRATQGYSLVVTDSKCSAASVFSKAFQHLYRDDTDTIPVVVWQPPNGRFPLPSRAAKNSSHVVTCNETTTTTTTKTPPATINEGHWTPEENLLFLKGLRQFGPGKWKMIANLLPTRTIHQVKSHGQRVLVKLKTGEDIFRVLHQAELLGKLPCSPHYRQHASICLLCHPPSYPNCEEEKDVVSTMLNTSDQLPLIQYSPSAVVLSTTTCPSHQHHYHHYHHHHHHQQQGIYFPVMSGEAAEARNDSCVLLSTSFNDLTRDEGPAESIRSGALDTTTRDDVEIDIALVLCELSASLS